LLDEAWCRHLAGALRGDARINSLLPRSALAVQCTLFDKSPTKNWLVALHQDLSIPVKARVDGPECSGWTEKEGQVYVQPPVSVLEQLVSVRVHIDDCAVESGALRVVPKSHVEGRLNKEQAEALRSRNGEIVVPVGCGGVLVIRPLLLHASSKATSHDPRRVLHFVFGPPKLPLGLEWWWAV
jgi:ectoine hydroxylase-related dioxygenase (phytanoyl-CoA dioxygenase family)